VKELSGFLGISRREGFHLRENIQDLAGRQGIESSRNHVRAGETSCDRYACGKRWNRRAILTSHLGNWRETTVHWWRRELVVWLTGLRFNLAKVQKTTSRESYHSAVIFSIIIRIVDAKLSTHDFVIVKVTYCGGGGICYTR